MDKISKQTKQYLRDLRKKFVGQYIRPPKMSFDRQDIKIDSLDLDVETGEIIIKSDVYYGISIQKGDIKNLVDCRTCIAFVTKTYSFKNEEELEWHLIPSPSLIDSLKPIISDNNKRLISLIKGDYMRRITILEDRVKILIAVLGIISLSALTFSLVSIFN